MIKSLHASTISLTNCNQPRFNNVNISTTKLAIRGGFKAETNTISNRDYANHNFESEIVKLSSGNASCFASGIPIPNNDKYWSCLYVYY